MAKKPVKKEILVSPPGGPTHGLGMVQGVKAGGFVFFSAIRGLDPGTGKASEDTQKQARQAKESLRFLMEAAGGTLEHVVKVTLYLEDLKYRAPFREVWMDYSPKDPPAPYCSTGG